MVDDDVTAGNRLSVGSLAVSESDVSRRTITVPVTLTSPATREVTFTFSTRSATARATQDFVGTQRSVTIPVGAVRTDVRLSLIGDDRVERDEDVTVRVSDVTGAGVGRTRGTVTIEDDDGRVAPAPIEAPASTRSIELVSSTQEQGYQLDFYRNTAYECSISGHQTFLVASRIGVPRTAVRPLWTHLHPGGIGWFDTNDQPVPDETYLREESLSALAFPYGLNLRVLEHEAGFRMLFVSYCNRDLYGGGGLLDPNNPNLLPGGGRRTTNGLEATKAAIQFTLDRYETSDHLLHGGSAGSAGSLMVGWALQRQGIPPAGLIADSYTINQEYVREIGRQGIQCENTGIPMNGATVDSFSLRLHPTLADPNNETDLLVRSGRLTVPLVHVWSLQDPFGCEGRVMACPLRNGSTVPLGGMDCMNEPLRRAIAAQGESSRSLSLRLCVREDSNPDLPCGRHVVTGFDGRNTLASGPADYNGRILRWALDRLADD